ncbi:MAG: CopD family protein [Casimicrobiaceae bacterium]
MALVKTLHIVFMVSWFAGLFYLPRLFVYHTLAPADDRIGNERFKVMERKLYFGIMTPAAVLTIVFGLWLMWGFGIDGGWLHVKLVLVAVLVAFHLYLGRQLRDFAHDRNRHGHVFYRWLNEIPGLPLLVAIVWLAVARPF